MNKNTGISIDNVKNKLIFRCYVIEYKYLKN